MIKPISKSSSNILNFIRGFSAQIVVLGHLLSLSLFQTEFNIPIIQNFGVILFFIMSGYLITHVSILKTSEYGFKNYFIDRFSRIYYTFIPALIFVVFIDLILIYYFKNYDSQFIFNTKNFTSNLFMFQSFPFINSFGIESFGSARPFWTVAIEFWFYIFFGILFYSKHIKFNLLIILLMIISFVYVFININGRGIGLSIYWFFGFLVALINSRFDLKLKKNQYTLIIVLHIIILLYRMIQYHSIYDVGVALIFSSFLFFLLNYQEGNNKVLNSKVFSKLSDFFASYSYSLYLVHYSLIIIFKQLFKENLNASHFVLIFILVNITAYLFYLIFEKNNYKLRTRLKQIK